MYDNDFSEIEHVSKQTEALLKSLFNLDNVC